MCPTAFSDNLCVMYHSTPNTFLPLIFIITSNARLSVQLTVERSVVQPAEVIQLAKFHRPSEVDEIRTAAPFIDTESIDDLWTS